MASNALEIYQKSAAIAAKITDVDSFDDYTLKKDRAHKTQGGFFYRQR